MSKQNFGVFIIMDVKVNKSQLNIITQTLLDRSLGNLKPIKANVDYALLFVNNSNEVLVAITGPYQKDMLNDYINVEPNYGAVKPMVVRRISMLLPFMDVSELKSKIQKYMRKKYGVNIDLSVNSTYDGMYINREQEFLNNN